MARNSYGKVLMKERRRWGFLGLPFTFDVYSLTERKLIINQGFLNRKEKEIQLYRVKDYSVKSNFAQTIFGLGLGTVVVYSNDVDDSTLEIKNIRHAHEFKEKLYELSEAERTRRGVRASEFMGGVGTGHDGHDGHFDGHDGGHFDGHDGGHDFGSDFNDYY